MILILRTLGFTQDEICDSMHCAKRIVVDAERWFADCPESKAIGLTAQWRLKKVIDDRFPKLELDRTDLIRAGRITSKDILLHYGRIHPLKDKPPTEATPGPVAQPIYTKLLEQHWEKLQQLAIELREQMSPPRLDVLLGRDFCQKVRAAGSVSGLFPVSDWVKLIDAPLELRLLPSDKEKVIEVRLLVEKEFLFPYLATHLEADLTEFPEFEKWHDQLGRIILRCLKVMERLTQHSSQATEMPYLVEGRGKGLTWWCPVYIYQFVLNYGHSKRVPRLDIIPVPGGLWRLVPTELLSMTLAIDTEDNIRRCQEVLAKEVKANARLKASDELRHDLFEFRLRSDLLQSCLSIIIERGDFKGTCSLCQSYFTGASPPAGSV